MALSGGGGDVEEVIADLTGGCAGRFATNDVAADRMWKYFTCIQNTTIWGCAIDITGCAKRNIPIARHWAAAIFDVRTDAETMPVVGVFTSAPLSSVKHFPLVEMPGLGEWSDFHQGYMWLRIDDFVQLFSEIYECRLVNSDLGLASQILGERVPRNHFGHVPGQGAAGRVVPGRPDPQKGAEKTFEESLGPWYETAWSFQGEADSTDSPSFFMRVPPGTEIIMSVSQECSRFQAGKKMEVYRSDFDKGIYKVTFKEYSQILRTSFGATARETNDRWENLPRVRNPNLEPEETTEDNTGFVVRQPQAPLLLRFYQCSADMDFREGRARSPRSRNQASSEPTPAGAMPEVSSGPGELHMVHMSAWGNTRDAMCCVKVRAGGNYVASVSMPDQYSCRRMSFRTYSNQQIDIRQYQWPRNVIITNPGAPVGALPFSLTGLPRLDSASDRLPRMLDEDEGNGQPQAGPKWVRALKKQIQKYEPDTMKRKAIGGPQATGYF
jgi:hypothetical protein